MRRALVYCLGVDLIQVLREVSQRAHLWDTFTDAFDRRWQFD